MNRAALKSAAGKIALAVAAPFVVLALLEGFASLFLLFRDVRFARPTVAERRHSRYDAELGWVAVPHAAAPGIYGPGKDLHTNSRGFRGRTETAESLPAGRHRVICSGDSFTLGYGVADDATWCALLADGIPGLEAVNMGQGGYGLDQAWLWYRRDGAHLAHDVHIFAFITDDFRRMKETRFLGYGKPKLAWRSDSLVVTNVPAPGFSRVAAWVDNNLTELRMVRLFQFSARLTRRSVPADSPDSDSATAQVAAAVIRDLARRHRERGSRLLVLHLPVRIDFGTSFSAPWRARMREAAEREGVTFVDLIDPFRRLPADSVAKMFIAQDALTYAGASGHYTEHGNRWVAAQLLPLLRAQSATSAPRLAER